ncbi:MAG TPA: methyltransferase domain-containing protein [Chryseolinea sp.]|nr:methyltransferase domain-containing protein [Chryseolinea sp.]
MNERTHWDKIAPSYNDEIFDVFKSDKDGKLVRQLKRYAKATDTAIDFGCGTGKALPLLSPRFKSVLAADISGECLATAKARGYRNVSYKRADLASKRIRLPPSDFVFCCNVIMLPEIARNEVMFQNIQRSLKPGGIAMIVVPSTDSMLYAAWRMIDWYRKEKVDVADIPASELAYFSGSKRDLLQGIIRIDGVATKHYSGPELQVLMNRAGLSLVKLEQLNYHWNSEFAEPPQWMQAPYPWDWMVICRRA